MKTKERNWLEKAGDEQSMNPPIEVLYAPDLWRGPHDSAAQPVVRYSDHCARVNALVAEIEQLTALAERLQSELAVAKYSQEATNDMIANIPSGRWDTKPKAL